MVYVRCPRCEINYKYDYEQYCDICKRELKGEIFDNDDIDDLICPFCEKNKLDYGQDMCDDCYNKKNKREDTYS
ncbi:MAG: hypothetical protein RR054_02080 [Clostridia bacterium]